MTASSGLLLLVRTLLSLLLVVGVIGGCYVVASRRRGLPGRVVGGSSARAPRRSGLQLLARVGTSRTSSVSAVRFGSRVLLVGSNDADVQVLAEMTLEEWTGPTVDEETAPARPLSTLTAPPSMIDLLRNATARRGRPT